MIVFLDINDVQIYLYKKLQKFDIFLNFLEKATLPWSNES